MTNISEEEKKELEHVFASLIANALQKSKHYKEIFKHLLIDDMDLIQAITLEYMEEMKAEAGIKDMPDLDISSDMDEGPVGQIPLPNKITSAQQKELGDNIQKHLEQAVFETFRNDPALRDAQLKKFRKEKN